MHFVLRALNVQIWCNSIHFFFSKVWTDDSDGCHDIYFSVLSFLWLTLETDVEFDEGCAQDWLEGCARDCERAAAHQQLWLG